MTSPTDIFADGGSFEFWGKGEIPKTPFPLDPELDEIEVAEFPEDEFTGEEFIGNDFDL